MSQRSRHFVLRMSWEFFAGRLCCLTLLFKMWTTFSSLLGQSGWLQCQLARSQRSNQPASQSLIYLAQGGHVKWRILLNGIPALSHISFTSSPVWSYLPVTGIYCACVLIFFVFFISCFVNILFIQKSYNWVVSCWCCNHKLDPGGGTPGNSWWGCAARFSRPERLKSVIFHTLFHTWSPFLESPVNFLGPKSNIQIEIIYRFSQG